MIINLSILGEGGGKGQIEYIVVTELPERGEEGKVYLVPKDAPTTLDIYTEYIWFNEQWENVGGTEIDLSNYYDKKQGISINDNVITMGSADFVEDDVNKLHNINMSNYYDKSTIDTKLDSKVNKTETVTFTATLEDGSQINYTLYGKEV